MCEFCTQHGQGKLWYLQAANHSRDLMEKLRVEEKIHHHAGSFETSCTRWLTIYDRLSPFWKVRPLKRLAHAWAARRQKKKHFGQILPAEHVHKVFEMAGSIVRLPCTCRRFVRGHKEERYCLGLGFDPYKVYSGVPDYGRDFEMLTPAQASRLADKFRAEEGLVHTVWTLPTPFIVSICNCSMSECGALFTNFKLGIEVLFPGEMKASVSPGTCNGCGRCLSACQFGALTLNKSTRKATVSHSRCQGCGVCREVCPGEAVKLEPPPVHERDAPAENNVTVSIR